MSKHKIQFSKETSKQAQEILKEIAGLFEKLDDRVGLEELIYSLTEVANRKWRADEMIMMMVTGFAKMISADNQVAEFMNHLEEAADKQEIDIEDDESDYTLN